jgi:hypothetical protein
MVVGAHPEAATANHASNSSRIVERTPTARSASTALDFVKRFRLTPIVHTASRSSATTTPPTAWSPSSPAADDPLGGGLSGGGAD